MDRLCPRCGRLHKRSRNVRKHPSLSKRSLPGGLLLLVGLWVLVAPGDAYAWGPATHIDFGLHVLKHAAVLLPFLRELLMRYPEDYLYGCCAADIVVGKNFAKYLYHCHNWQVGLRVLESAYEPRQKALCYGFLTHLAADIVAHNFFVPYKTVESFHKTIAKHTYWELRFDQIKISQDDSVLATLRRVGQSRFPDHDAFLEEMLVGSSRLFSFGTSKRIFDSMMLLSRLEQWQNTMSAVARRSELPLTTTEFKEFDQLAKNAVFALLIDLEDSRTVKVDPTGGRNLAAAKVLRRELRELDRSHRFTENGRQAMLENLRSRFREGIYAPLDIPDTKQLVLASR